MAARSTVNAMERLRLSDEDTADLWNSPSQRGAHQSYQSPSSDDGASHHPRHTQDGGVTLFDRQEAREAALQHELRTVQHVNGVIEDLLSTIENAKSHMEHVSKTVQASRSLLRTWTRILSMTEHNQRLILNSNWQGATQDVADMENEAIQRQQAAERHERELQQQREAAFRRAEEEERRRLVTGRGGRGGRGTSRGTSSGTSRGTARSTGLGRVPSVSTSRTGVMRGASTSNTQRPASGIGRGSAIARGRGRA